MIIKQTCILGFLLLLLSSQASAVDDEFYYRLGGGVPIGLGATNRSNTLKLGAGLSWNADLTCGNFDFTTSITNQLNGITGAFQNAMSGIITAAQGVVASLPALIIQRINPALYDLLQNGILQASEEFNLAEVSCEEIVDSISKNVSSEGWDSQAKSNYWTKDSNTAGTDILDTKKKAETQGLDNGVTWVGDTQAGGAGQQPIKIHEDTSVAGYNLLLLRNATNTSTVSAGACSNAQICTAWNSPNQAAAWITDVLGEAEILTCQNCDKMKTSAGMGMQRKYEQEKLAIETAMTSMVNGSAIPNQATLNSIAGGQGFVITRQIIEAIRAEESPVSVISRLSGELAISRTLERALMARRVLLAGMKEPNVANNDLAVKELQRSVDELNSEIQNMVFELDVRSKVASNTTVQLLQRATQRNQAPVVESSPAQTIREGATN